jgi:hypothetical protein
LGVAGPDPAHGSSGLRHAKQLLLHILQGSQGRKLQAENDQQ